MIDAVLQRLGQLHPKVIDLSLDRVLALLDRLGNPQTRLPPVIHVAGTNGKGSTVAFLRAIAEAAGLRVHVYTSPHLVRFAERIRLAGQIIAEDALLALLEEIEAVNDGAPITFFEITTIAAFVAFSRVPADLVILETGLGGRLDASNVVDHPIATVITPIALDHQSFLGDTLAAIAGEKAGIMKPGALCFAAPQAAEAHAVLAARAQAVAAPLIGDFSWQEVGGRLRVTTRHHALDLPPPGLAGAYQFHNAGLAVAVIDHLSHLGVAPFVRPLSPDVIAQGLRAVEWPARLQRLTHGPLVESLPQGWEVYLDGGHNPHAAQAIAAHALGWRDRPLFGIFGILSNKDVDGYMAPMAPCFAALRSIAIPGEAATLSAEDAARTARRHGCPDVRACDDVAQALGQLTRLTAQPSRVLICGSLYLAGHVLTDNG